MPISDAQKRALKKYAEANPEVLRAARQRHEEKRPPRKRDRAKYMREYRARKKLEQDQPEG
jgi:hypothetical protein